MVGTDPSDMVVLISKVERDRSQCAADLILLHKKGDEAA